MTSTWTDLCVVQLLDHLRGLLLHIADYKELRLPVAFEEPVPDGLRNGNRGSTPRYLERNLSQAKLQLRLNLNSKLILCVNLNILENFVRKFNIKICLEVSIGIQPMRELMWSKIQ
uniref:Uncharacterized protein n=1 Tax=Graphocephala atropunctata TaxID=36148 RepID=A0A1B6KJI8_9HEMI